MRTSTLFMDYFSQAESGFHRIQWSLCRACLVRCAVVHTRVLPSQECRGDSRESASNSCGGLTPGAAELELDQLDATIPGSPVLSSVVSTGRLSP